MAKNTKKFNVSAAQIGDVIPSGTIVYKKVRGPTEDAILTGVVTRAGIVTDAGAMDKNRVRAIMPVSIRAWNQDNRTWDGDWLDSAKSTPDGITRRGKHPDGITYVVGERVSSGAFDTTTQQCSTGIHVYLTRAGAEAHY